MYIADFRNKIHRSGHSPAEEVIEKKESTADKQVTYATGIRSSVTRITRGGLLVNKYEPIRN